MTFSKSFCEEYVNYFIKYKEEYGENICILMQMGTFYEIQNVLVNGEYVGNLEKVANMLNIHITSKRSKTEIEEIPKVKFAGFPKVATTKFLPVLIDNGYTVILVDENKIGNKITRSVSGIYSSSIQPFFINEKDEDNSLTSIFIETINGMNKKEMTVMYSIINTNTTINKCNVYEKNIGGLKTDQLVETVLDDVYNTVLRYNANEYLIYIRDTLSINLLEKENIINYLDLNNKNVHYNDKQGEEYNLYQKTDYQNEYLKRVYNINFGLLEPVEYFDLNMCQTSIINLLYTIDFIGRHDVKYISNLAIPELINEETSMVLEMNTIKQLNILSNDHNKGRFDSLFNTINKTSTVIGKRSLKAILTKPLKNIKEISDKYEFSEYIEKIGVKNIEPILNEIYDFEKLHRKMALEVLHPYEFKKLDKTYNNIILLDNLIQKLDKNTLTQLKNYIEEYTKIFNIEELSKYTLQEINGNIFNIGVIKELDDIYNKIIEFEKEMEEERLVYEKIINPTAKGNWLKIILTEEGYVMTCTKLRANTLKGQDIEIKNNTSTTKITTKNLKKISNNLLNHKDIFDKKIKQHYIINTGMLYNKYNSIYNNLKNYIADIDVAKSNIKCKLLYKYCKPNIINEVSGNAFLEAKEMRHPIIERINNNTSYIPNDVSLNDSESGIVLYALNSCGKSSLLRSIGLCLIMAQSGLYVPCNSFDYSPFNSIITQVDLYDNLWKAQSSFISEMIGLKKIIKMGGKKCLVLADEISKGTENVSASAILASSIIHLINKECRFVFTTHLHDIPKFDEIKALKNLGIYNLSVSIDENNTIIFERKLQKGPCSELYGLEVAKAIGLDTNLINKAFELRNIILNNKKKIYSTSKSKYNSKKIVNKCEICNYCPVNIKDKPLHTHHIKFQCESDANGFNGHFYKNSKFNLVSLCDNCHIKVHSGEININGYIQTINGVELK